MVLSHWFVNSFISIICNISFSQKMKIILISLGIFLIFGLSRSYYILGLFPLQSKSHMLMFEALMKGLAERGHEVDVLSHFPQKKPIPRYNDLSVPWGGDRIGNPDNPSYIPNYLVFYPSKMSLVERVINTVILISSKLGYMVATEKSNAIAQEFFGPDLPHLQDLARNVSLILVNSHFTINHVRPMVPNFVEVGGLHIGQPKAFPKHLEDSLKFNPQYKGVIYLSMGSMVVTETLPLSKLKALFDSFRDLPYQVLWKAVKENMPKELDIPSNIQFEPWMPQLDILCHPNVKLFVTQGGLLGSQEGIYCGVPRLGIPFFADQELNLKASEAMGVAIMVNYDEISKEKLSAAIEELLYNPKYKANVDKASKLFKDRPVSALDTAIYWVEYVIRHNGAPHLRSAGADLPWYQYFLIDVGVILFVSLVLALVLIYCCIKCILRILISINRKILSKLKID